MFFRDAVYLISHFKHTHGLGVLQSKLLLSTLSGAAAGQVGFCLFPQVNAVIVHAAQILRADWCRICTIKESKVIRELFHQYLFIFLVSSCSPAVICCILTNGQAVVANRDRGSLHREATGQAAQNRLNRVASGFLTVDVHWFLQLHRFKLHAALCVTKKVRSEFLMV